MTPFSPKSRTKKKYHSNKLVDYLQSRNLVKHMMREVIISTIEKLNLDGILYSKSKLKFEETRGRKMTSFTTRTLVWEIWHAYRSESSDTTRLAKLCQSSQNKIQSGLKFPPSVKTIIQHGRLFYKSMWRITLYPYQILYNGKFLKQHLDN